MPDKESPPSATAPGKACHHRATPPPPNNMNGNQWYFSVGGQHRGTYPQWPTRQINGIVAVCAAFMLARGWPNANRTIHHREWTRRRIDMSYRGDLRGRTSALMSGTPIPPPNDWLDMDESTLRRIIREEAHRGVIQGEGGNVAELGQAVTAILNRTGDLVSRDVGDLVADHVIDGEGGNRNRVHQVQTATLVRTGQLLDQVGRLLAATPTAAGDYPPDADLTGTDL